MLRSLYILRPSPVFVSVSPCHLFDDGQLHCRHCGYLGGSVHPWRFSPFVSPLNLGKDDVVKTVLGHMSCLWNPEHFTHHTCPKSYPHRK